MPYSSCSTLAIGARQLVVHEATETTWCFPFSYALSLTPITSVASAPFEGAETATTRAPAVRCAAALSRSVNRPVASSTTSTPSSFHGSSAGSLTLRIRIVFPETLIASPSAVTSSGHTPCTESYCSRCASVAASVTSLAATNSMSAFRLSAARTTSRPMRPNPLMPTRTAMNPPILARDSPNHFIERRRHRLERAGRLDQRHFGDARSLERHHDAERPLVHQVGRT